MQQTFDGRTPHISRKCARPASLLHPHRSFPHLCISSLLDLLLFLPSPIVLFPLFASLQAPPRLANIVGLLLSGYCQVVVRLFARDTADTIAGPRTLLTSLPHQKSLGRPRVSVCPSNGCPSWQSPIFNDHRLPVAHPCLVISSGTMRRYRVVVPIFECGHQFDFIAVPLLVHQ